MQNCNSIQLVATGVIAPIIPPAGEERVYERFGSTAFDASPAPDAVPLINVGIYDGDPLKVPAWVKTTLNVRGWNHKGKLYVSPTNYLVLQNPAAGGAGRNLSAIGNISRQFGSAPLEVVTDIVNLAIGAGGGIDFADVRPPPGEEWIITDIGAELWNGAGAPADVPEVNVDLVQAGPGGVLAFARMLRSTDIRGWLHAMAFYLSNDVWLRITNPNIATNCVCWSGTKLQTYASGQPNVMSQVLTDVLAGGGILEARPASNDEEWLVTAFGSSAWFAGLGAPNDVPDVDVQLVSVAPALVSLLAQNTDMAHQLSPLDLPISRANYMRMTDTSLGANDMGFSAIRTSLLA